MQPLNKKNHQPQLHIPTLLMHHNQEEDEVAAKATPQHHRHDCQIAIARFLDSMCLAIRASGLWLHYATLQNLIPSFPWIAPPRPPPRRNPRKGRDQILPSGNLDHRWRHQHVKVETVETQEDEEEENVDINAVVQEAVVALVVEDDESESGFAFMPQHNNDCEETN